MGLAGEVVGAGPELVLLHGVGLDRGMWERCVPALASRHRVRLIDLRGHGSSPRASEGVSLADLAADVAGELEGAAHVVGFSLGALVAQQLALGWPELTLTLTLVSSVADRSEEERAAVAGRRERARVDFEGSARAAVERWFSEGWRSREPGLEERVLGTLLANDRASYLACYDVFATGDAELWPRLPEIKVPALAVTGSEDPGSTPEMTWRLGERIPGARAEVVEGARHLLPLERPGELVGLILRHTAAWEAPTGVGGAI